MTQATFRKRVTVILNRAEMDRDALRGLRNALVALQKLCAKSFAELLVEQLGQ